MLAFQIVDFGFAKRLVDGKDTRVMQGTPEFASPEVINYDPISTKTDMWSVGVITYVLLSGLSPFLGLDNQVILNEFVFFGSSLHIFLLVILKLL